MPEYKRRRRREPPGCLLAGDGPAPSRAARHAEWHPTVAETDVPAARDDEVIEDRDVEQPTGRNGFRGEPEIVRAGLGIAGRVVVYEDDSGRVQPDGVTEELRHPDHRS